MSIGFGRLSAYSTAGSYLAYAEVASIQPGPIPSGP